jgi:hypothetical protein
MPCCTHLECSLHDGVPVFSCVGNNGCDRSCVAVDLRPAHFPVHLLHIWLDQIQPGRSCSAAVMSNQFAEQMLQQPADHG